MKSKLEIYALAICFTSVICLVISFGIGGYVIVTIGAPEFTMNSYEYKKFTSNDAYWENINSCYKDEKCKDRPSEDVLTKERNESKAIAIKEEKRTGMQLLIQCLIFITASGVALYIHSKIAKQARTE